MQHTKTFIVDKAVFTFGEMLEANESDPEFCAWLASAEVGGIFADGEGCERTA